MRKITATTILNTLAIALGFKWKTKNGKLRANLHGNNTHYCPLGVYVKLEHNLDVAEDDVEDFCNEWLNIDADITAQLVKASDNTVDELKLHYTDGDAKWNAELTKLAKLRIKLETATIFQSG